MVQLKKYPYLGIIILILVFISLFSIGTYQAKAQQPTAELPTVTGTPEGPVVVVRPQEQDQINVRAGPGTTYPKVGVLIIGQQAAAKGRSAGGEWIMIEYSGVQGSTAWVYAPLVSLQGGELPIMEPPPTPTPLYTPTIDPTLAARFVVTSAPTSLPTFTEPAPLKIPTYDQPSTSGLSGRVPMGLVIIVLAAGGIFIGLFTLAQRR